MTVFISGGCKNGKSTLAERTAKALAGDGPLYYIATMIPHDEEDEERIRRHVAARAGMGFITLEQGRDILQCLSRAREGGAFLMDSVTALLSNEMFRPGGVMDWNAGERVADDLLRFARSCGNAVFVSDFIYSDAGRYDEYTEAYRRGLALCDKTLARACDTVVEVCSSNFILHKGELPV
ncbi:MAG: bifunctional adenosylcobinamide kinase/adenosylcobinamide-phosphate guanylyltransferase [Oscillospiraceae bacterium]|nr:bifunctional adenosylcobinamide kinase/adenosylcobinamide-phosphate guanylyltransferase [Oscillospiraceae bacterium]